MNACDPCECVRIVPIRGALSHGDLLKVLHYHYDYQPHGGLCAQSTTGLQRHAKIKAPLAILMAMQVMIVSATLICL